MMRFDRFTERAQEAAQRAAEIIQRYGHNQIDTEHILLALIEQPQGVIPQILEDLKVDVEALTERLDYVLRTSPKANIFGGGAGQIFITPRVKRIVDLANQEANRLKDEYISTEHLFLAILSERNTPSARLLEGAGVTKDRVNESVQQVRGGQRVTDPQAETRYRVLEKYSRDLTTMAREAKLDPVIGRDSEILRVIQILSRRTKNNPVLIGEAGVGKTAIVEGLAQKNCHE
jgi:ATP-dependent Clp protease ATP-binding subunit ClpC